MPAGENTLNAYCARLLTCQLAKSGLRYEVDDFLKSYIEFMTSDEPQHPDTYAESYHRGFFANLVAGKPARECGAVTHDTPSVGGLVTVGPLAIAELLRNRDLPGVQQLVREHVNLTHPDAQLLETADSYVKLIDDLLFRNQSQSDPVQDMAECRKFIAQAAKNGPFSFNVEQFV